MGTRLSGNGACAGMSVRTRRSCAATTSSTCSSKGSTSLARPSWHPSCRRTRKLPHRARSHLAAPALACSHLGRSHLGLLPLTGGAEPSLALGQVCAVVPRVGRRAACDDRRARGRVYDRGEGPDRSALPAGLSFPSPPAVSSGLFVGPLSRACLPVARLVWLVGGLFVRLFVCLVVWLLWFVWFFVCLVVWLFVFLWSVRASVTICTAVRLVSACWPVAFRPFVCVFVGVCACVCLCVCFSQRCRCRIFESFSSSARARARSTLMGATVGHAASAGNRKIIGGEKFTCTAAGPSNIDVQVGLRHRSASPAAAFAHCRPLPPTRVPMRPFPPMRRSSTATTARTSLGPPPPPPPPHTARAHTHTGRGMSAPMAPTGRTSAGAV